MDASMSAQIIKIAQQLQPLDRLNDPLWRQPDFLGSIIVSSVALFIAVFSEPLKRAWQNTNLKVVGILIDIDSSGKNMHAILEIENMGNTKAEDVEVHVEDIIPRSGSEINRFQPIPLKWTYSTTVYKSAGALRNIHPKQSVLLNLFFLRLYTQRVNNEEKSYWQLQFETDAGGQRKYATIIPGKTLIKIAGYQQSGKNFKKTLSIELKVGENPIIKVKS